MPIIRPPKLRHTVADDGAAMTITIPSSKNAFVIVFFSIWLMIWSISEIAILGGLVTSILQPAANQPMVNGPETAEFLPFLWIGGLFMFVWLLVWTAVGLNFWYTFLWQLVGKEIVIISPSAISIRRAVFSMGRMHEYLASEIKDLRVSPVGTEKRMFGWSGGQVFGLRGGHLCFDYGAKTFRFGSGADEAEAKIILQKIGARFPQYCIAAKSQ